MTIAARFRIDRGGFSLDVDFEIPSRGVTGLFGPSGCGKTTLLRAIAGLDTGAGGYLKVDGRIWQDEKRFLPPHKRPIGYVFQEPSLFSHLNVRRNLEYGLRRLPPGERRVSVEHAVELLGIGHLLGRAPQQLSGGEQQRVAIARALAVSPAMLLLDEPLAGLDLARRREIMPYLESLHRDLDIPVLYVSHSRDEVARLGDHMVLLEAGRVVATGPLERMFSRFDLSLAHRPDAGTVINAVVAGHDEEFDLTCLDFPGGRFFVARHPLPASSTVRLQVAATDVSIALERQSGSSILNVFPATIDEIAPGDDGQVTVRMMAGPVPILARITRKSAVELALQPGKTVHAQVKSVALLS